MRSIKLQALEGRHVNVALRDGSRIDDCQLVSVGRNGATTIWLYSNQVDVFVPFQDVIDIWEVATLPSVRAA